MGNIKKRSMSGLIITVLLVAVAVALTAMFIGFVTSLTGSQMDAARQSTLKMDYCGNILYELLDIRIVNVSNNASINLTVKNYGTLAFDGFRIRFNYRDGTFTVFKNYFFVGGTLGSGAQNGLISIDASEGINYNDLVSMEFYPVVSITTPVKTVLECDIQQRQQDLTRYKLG